MVRREHAVVTRKVDARRRHQCGQAGHKVLRASCPSPFALRASLRLLKIAPGDFVERLEHDIRSAVTVRGLQTVANTPLGSGRQSRSRDSRARDICENNRDGSYRTQAQRVLVAPKKCG